MSKKLSLLQLATEINNKFLSAKANYVEMGKMLIIARERVKIESNMKWHEWCKNYLRKINGKPFAAKTLENYMYLARDPQRVDNQRQMQKNNIRSIRKRAKGIETADAVVGLFTKHMSVADQLNILMTA